MHLKDAPDKIIHQSPDNTAFHKYYYSQPAPGGGRDDALEDFFSKSESDWPRIVELLQARQDMNGQLDAIVTFMALQRARVPASRDATERMDAQMVLATARLLDAQGRLPPKPAGFEDLLDHVQVTVDPHRSIHAMVDVITAVGTIIDLIGIGALHNKTDTPFLTSDNPVIWFDGAVPEGDIQPYRVRPDGSIVLLFPVSSNVIIYGNSSMRERFAAGGFRHSDLLEPAAAQMMNRQICRFAHEAVFSRDPGQATFVREFADVSAILRSQDQQTERGMFVFHEMIFGKRQRKAKWRG